MTAIELGVLGVPGRVRIDARGGVAVGSYDIGWTVRGASRWFDAAEEAAVRQGLDGAEVVATRMRVEGGDIVHRVWVVPLPGGAAAAVVEVTNETAGPVGLGLAIRAAGSGSIGSMAAHDATIEVDGRPVVIADRPMRAVESRDTGVWPLPHGTTMRFAVPLAGGDIEPAEVGRLPPSASVARGWDLHLDRAARIDSGDAALDGTVAAALRRQLLAAEVRSSPAPDRAITALALASWGLRDEAAAVVASLLDVDVAPAADGPAAVSAAAALWGLHRTEALVQPALTLASTIGPRLERVARRRWGAGRGLLRGSSPPPWPGDARSWAAWATGWAAAALRGGAVLATSAGEIDGAASFGRAADRVARGLASAVPGDPSCWLDALFGPHLASRPTATAGSGDAALSARLLEGAVTAGPGTSRSELVGVDRVAGVGDSAVASAFAALFVRRLLIAEHLGGFDVVPCTIAAPGVGTEVHDLPTRWGTASFAVRWHGERPALLWELRPHPGIAPVRITASGLDSSFASEEPAGEMLLAAPDVGGRSQDRR